MTDAEIITQCGDSRLKGENRSCPQCDSIFYVKRCHLKERRFCSRKCYWQSMKGKLPAHIPVRRGPDAVVWRGGRTAAARRYREAHQSQYTIYAMNRRVLAFHAEGEYFLAEWEALKARFNHQCVRCGVREPFVKLTADHIVPLLLGGSNNIRNIQPLCQPCNSRKHLGVLDYRILRTPQLTAAA